MLTIDTVTEGDVTVLRLAGRIVLEDDPSPLRTEIERLMKEGRCKLVLDLTGVTYIDSAGLGLMVAKFVSLRKNGGDLRLVHLTPRSMHLMAITNLSTIFEVHPNEAAAIRSFAQ
jgi:anti-sigma B factor antagonist